jgi:phage FluMu protein Com
MDPFTLFKIGTGAYKVVDYLSGDKCPRCGTSSGFKQTDKGTTWLTGKKKVECGKCGKVFTVD